MNFPSCLSPSVRAVLGGEMSSFAIVVAQAVETERSEETQRDYIPLIRQMMAEKGTAQRWLAGKTGISKTRLGLLLHSDPKKRSPMTVAELETILHGLDMDIVQAFVRLKAFEGLEILQRERYATLILMLCEVFVGLPRKVIEILEELEGIDGSEVRKEWAGIVQKGVVKQLTEEVGRVLKRRSMIAERDEF